MSENGKNEAPVAKPVGFESIGADPRGQPMYVAKFPGGISCVITMPYNLDNPGQLDLQDLMTRVRKRVDADIKDLPAQVTKIAKELLAMYCLDVMQEQLALADDYAMMFLALADEIPEAGMDEKHRRQLQAHRQFAERYLEATLAQNNSLHRIRGGI